MATTATTNQQPPPRIVPAGAGGTNRPLRLPDLQAAIHAALGLAEEATFALEELGETLERVDDPLTERIDRNRARSRRYRLTGSLRHATNGHNGGDDRLVITKAGIVLQCKRCDRVLAIDATPTKNRFGRGRQ